jgi:hypothetical protein
MDRYYQTTFTVPPATLASNPATVAVQTEDALLVDIEVIIPDGHMGLTGIRVRQSGQQILPWANLSWITGNRYERVFQVNTEIGSKSLSLQGFNTDFRNHTFYVRFHLRDLGSTAVAPASPDQRAIPDILNLSSGTP